MTPEMTAVEGTKSKCKDLLVAAIDIGTTYSGYAFSFRYQYEKDPAKISANTVWASGSTQLVSLKTPTVLLLHWNECEQEFKDEAFGYEAENKFEELVLHGEQESYYLAKHFKMELYNKTASTGLNRNSTFSLGQEKTIKLTELFRMSIVYLKTHLIETLQKRNNVVSFDDIFWVLTVPAIWTDAGKQIMMESAIEAGIKSDKLTLVLEPEAASLFCLHLPSWQSQGSMLTEGTKYMVVDAGGGTVDINIHQVQEGYTIAELQAACGGPWGGTMVNNAFQNMISDIVGTEVLGKFSAEYPDDQLELHRDFEMKKRNFDVNTQRTVIRLPLSLVQTYESVSQQSCSEAISKTKYKDTVIHMRDKILIDAKVMHMFFRDSCDNIVTFIDEILASKADEDISTIILVGGYAESHIIQNAITSQFQNLKVIVPKEEAGLAVLKGAVIYGHNPGAVLSRVAQRTYGVEVSMPFQENFHIESKKTFIEDKAYCKDVFSVHIRRGEDMKWKQCHVSKPYFPIERGGTSLHLYIFSSTEANPTFVTDDSCTRIGNLTVAIPDVNDGLSRNVFVSFQFDSQLKVIAISEATEKETTTFIDFLSD